MPKRLLIALPLALLAACAGQGTSLRQGYDEALSDRLVRRAAGYLGEKGPFRVGDQRFLDDCSGYVSAVYEAEGIPLRRLMWRAAPREASGVAATFAAARQYGVVFGGGGAWPAPGDLVFFHDTFDHNRDGRLNDPFTHIGIVVEVTDGTVVFLHRAGKAVVKGYLTPERPGLARDGDRVLNSTLRDKKPAVPGAPALAGQLFQGYGRLDPERIPRDLAARR